MYTLHIFMEQIDTRRWYFRVAIFHNFSHFRKIMKRTLQSEMKREEKNKTVIKHSLQNEESKYIL